MLNNLWNLFTAFAENDAAVEGTVAGGAGGAGGIIEMIIMMVVMVVIFYFLLIRPQRKKDKAVKDMLNALKVGDRICTIGGIYGTITGIQDDTIRLSVGKDNMSMVVARWAIRSVEEVQIENDAQELN